MTAPARKSENHAPRGLRLRPTLRRMHPLRAGVHAARQAKHAAFVAGKRTSWKLDEARWALITTAARTQAPRRPYAFDPARYRRSFVVRPSPDVTPGEVPRRVFTIWAGDNELTPNRRRSLEAMRETIGVPVVLITPDTMLDWVVDGHPLHPALEHLSLVHRSDYLRAYLLHHHGGGYLDLKTPTVSWNPAFERFAADPSAWIASYPEARAQDPARLPGQLGRDIALNFPRLAGSGAILARPHSPFTAEWLRELHRRLDYLAPQLAEFPGGVRGEVVGYPVSWTDLMGKIYHPLQLKHLAHIRQDASLLPQLTDYQ